MDFSKLLDLSELIYRDFFEFLHGFVKINAWISQSCYMDLSKFIHVFLLVVTWIFQSSYMNLSKLNMDLLKLLLRTEGV